MRSDSKPKNVESKFEPRKSEELKYNNRLEESKITDDKRIQQLRANKEVDNQRFLDMNSLKRREDMNRRKATAASQDGNRFANIGIRTPHDNKVEERGRVVIRRRSNKNDFWQKITNSIN